MRTGRHLPHQADRRRTRPRSTATRLTATVVLAAVALVSACTDPGPDDPLGLGEQAAGEVLTELDCSQLTDVSRAQLTSLVESGGNGLWYYAEEDLALTEGDATEPTGGSEDAAKQQSPGAPSTTGILGEGSEGGDVIAGTNVREEGVDESDIVKTDGRRIVSVHDGVLRVVGLDDDPSLDGTLPLADASTGATAELFLREDEALVVLSSYGGYLVEEIPAGEDFGAAEPAEPPAGPESTETTEPPTTPETTEPPTTPETTEPTTETTEPTTTEPTTTVPPPEPIPFESGVTLVRVDLSDPSRPAEIERSTVEGSLVAARMVGETPRIVVRSYPSVIDDLLVATSQGEADEAEAIEVVEGLDAEDLLPRVSDSEGVQSLGGCGDVAVLPTVDAPEADEALTGMTPPPMEPTTVTVLTVGEDLADLAPTTVQGMADVVYASPTALYVTAANWSGEGTDTAIHRFDTAGDGAATYTGSGSVPGTVLDDYSLSEAGGNLRVVTTVEGSDAVGTDDGTEEPDEQETTTAGPDGPVVVTPSGPSGGAEIEEPVEERVVPPMPATEGRLTILRPDQEGALVEISHVDDLGEGETVQSVRFVGEIAYVVTFRRTDPLYAIDLSDPEDPVVLGELKVTGFSEYLHPVGDGLLLGIGREADESGSDEGFKVSLFDVTDPTAPAELDKIVTPDGWSLVSQDPHAFTWDPVANHAIIPVQRYQGGSCGPDELCVEEYVEPTNGALVVEVADGGLEQVAELRHSESGSYDAAILRSLVVDRDLWTLSGAGLGRSDADDPTTVELIEF